MTNLPSRRLILAIVGLTCVSAQSNVKLPALFGDHMVLQQEAKLPVWGWADPSENVTVTLGDQAATTTARADGAWRVDLPAMKDAGKPLTLVVAGKNRLKFDDVLVGEVWVASGQSNMGFSLNGALNASTAVPRAADDQLRFFSVKMASSSEVQKDVVGQWVVSDSTTAARFSAVAYFFGKSLRQSVGRPVGIIGSYWGGTPAQSWTRLESLKRQPSLARYVAEYESAVAEHEKVVASPQLLADYETEEKQWKKEVGGPFGNEMKKYFAAVDAAHAAGAPEPNRPRPLRPEPVNPDPTATPNSGSRPHVPSVLFNAMIAPLTPYAIRGAIWYQGEANGSQGVEYRALFPALITGWRSAWGQGDFPFLYVQLPNFKASGADKDEWAYLREAQLMTLSLPNTGMAVTIDLGDPQNVHPKDKADVGDRLARVARSQVYHQDVPAYGPQFKAFKVEGAAIRINFTHVEGGLTIGAPPTQGPGIIVPPADMLSGFRIAGSDRAWHAADAKIDGDSVVVSSPEVSAAAHVRYGFLNAPICNLYNRAGLPASPFRTDDWDDTPGKKK